MVNVLTTFIRDHGMEHSVYAKELLRGGEHVDLLLYDDAVLYSEGLDVPREEILEQAYVLKPLSQILPEHRHPVSGERYAALWEEMASAVGEQLKEVTLNFEPAAG